MHDLSGVVTGSEAGFLRGTPTLTCETSTLFSVNGSLSVNDGRLLVELLSGVMVLCLRLLILNLLLGDCSLCLG